MPRRTEEGFPSVNPDELLDDWKSVKICATLAIGREAGWTVEELAEHMTVSSRQAYGDLDRYRTMIDELQKIARPLIKVSRRDVKAVAVKELRAKMEGMLGGAVAAIQDAIESGEAELAVKCAWRLIEQLEGKPTSTVNVNQSGTVHHAHLHVMDAATIAAFEASATRDTDLIARANQLAAASTPDSAHQRPSEAVIDA